MFNRPGHMNKLSSDSLGTKLNLPVNIIDLNQVKKYYFVMGTFLHYHNNRLGK